MSIQCVSWSFIIKLIYKDNGNQSEGPSQHRLRQRATTDLLTCLCWCGLKHFWMIFWHFLKQRFPQRCTRQMTVASGLLLFRNQPSKQQKECASHVANESLRWPRCEMSPWFTAQSVSRIIGSKQRSWRGRAASLSQHFPHLNSDLAVDRPESRAALIEMLPDNEMQRVNKGDVVKSSPGFCHRDDWRQAAHSWQLGLNPSWQ